MLILLLLMETAFAGELPDTTLLENIPLESEVLLTQKLSVEFTHGAKQNFQIPFFEGKINSFDTGYGHTLVENDPALVWAKSEIPEPTSRTGTCYFYDDPKDYGESVPLHLLPGRLFTLRGRGYELATLAGPSDPLHMKDQIVIYNKPTFSRGQLPSLQCVNGDGRKPTLGDLKRITGGIIKIGPPTSQ